MNLKISVSLLVTSVFLLDGCTSGSPLYRLTVDHKICGADYQEKPEKLSESDALEFFKVLAPIADLDRAVQAAPKKDNEKIKRPEVQDKIVTDMREKCLLNEKESESLGKDFENQTFKYKRKTVEKDTTKTGVTCPVAVIEEVVPLQEAPAVVEETNANGPENKNVLRSVKADIKNVAWQKQDSTYKLLGAVSSLVLKGNAETLFYKKLPLEQVDPGFQNVILYVREKYALNLNLDGDKKMVGHYNTCRKLQEDIDPEGKKPKARFEATVTRIGLKVDKDKTSEAKFISVLRYEFDVKTQSWVLDRSVRNDFYLNNVLLTPDELTALDKKRRDSIGFTKP